MRQRDHGPERRWHARYKLDVTTRLLKNKALMSKWNCRNGRRREYALDHAAFLPFAIVEQAAYSAADQRLIRPRRLAAHVQLQDTRWAPSGSASLGIASKRCTERTRARRSLSGTLGNVTLLLAPVIRAHQRTRAHTRCTQNLPRGSRRRVAPGASGAKIFGGARGRPYAYIRGRTGKESAKKKARRISEFFLPTASETSHWPLARKSRRGISRHDRPAGGGPHIRGCERTLVGSRLGGAAAPSVATSIWSMSSRGWSASILKCLSAFQFIGRLAVLGTGASRACAWPLPLFF